MEPGYAREMLAIFGEIDIAQLVELYENGVEADFAAGLRAEFPDLEPASIIEAAEEGAQTDDLDFFLKGRGRDRPAPAADTEVHDGHEGTDGEGQMRT